MVIIPNNYRHTAPLLNPPQRLADKSASLVFFEIFNWACADFKGQVLEQFFRRDKQKFIQGYSLRPDE